jgi:dTDP-4-amino-4,6-dideoxygalactose transaminase
LKAYRDLHTKPFPESEAWASEELSLPIYPELDDEQVRHVASRLISELGSFEF